MERITSLSNPRIKEIRKLRERKVRLETGVCLVEGLRIVAEALEQHAAVETLIVAPELLHSDFGQNLVQEQAQRGCPVLEVSAEVFTSFSVKEGPQGLAAVIRQGWYPLQQVEVSGGALWVALDAVADPGNLGTILRTLDAVGGAGVILLDQSTDPYDPAAVRGSMGAVFTQRLVRATFAEFEAWKKASGAPLIGTSGGAAVDYQTYRYPAGMVLLMGSERMGLLPHHFNLCDAVVSIPMAGKMDSLNLAVATAVTLYEIFNQRRSNVGNPTLNR